MAVQRSSTLVQQRQTYSMNGKSMASGSGSSRRFAAAAADSLAPVQCQQVLLAWSVASSSGVECSVMDCGQDLPAGFKAPLLIVGEQPAHQFRWHGCGGNCMCYTNGMHASGVRVCWHGCVVPIYKRMCWYGRLRTGRHTQLFAIAVPLWWSAACFVLHSADSQTS
jgi:hypothetical protein